LPEVTRVHGGGVLAAAQAFGIAPEQWLDLSTGINPLGWPVPPLPTDCWQRLPQEEDGLLEVAQSYYGTEKLLPVAGSQAALMALPRLRPRSRVGLLAPGYAEHALAWQREGHEVSSLHDAMDIEAQLDELDVLLLIQPNNPTGLRYAPQQLLGWHERLATRGGWLVVDEAFIDATPELSIASASGREGLIVLRSLGKFFGLAGVRVGFVLAWEELLQRLDGLLGPWSVSGPSREVARLALLDESWQQATRQRLLADGERLSRLLERFGLASTGTSLFRYCRIDVAEQLWQALAQRGILLRRFTEPAALRFGLPGEESQWRRLEQVLDEALTAQEVYVCRG